ncbi:MAG: hypothetical protein M5U34_15085 [Chloroflexi bacterium]|nr:hypothetical protein [Chloroflexota bacterium]
MRWLGRWLPGPLKTEGETPIARLLDAVESCGWYAVGGALFISAL